MIYINFENHGDDNPHRRSVEFGPYVKVQVEPEEIVVHEVNGNLVTIALRDNPSQWYCDLDGDLYTDAIITSR